MVAQLELRLDGHGFDSRPFCLQVTTLNKLFTHTRAFVTKRYNLVLVAGQ